jgi:dTDP-4-amino-4,6-dideoxygalactose transaminase
MIPISKPDISELEKAAVMQVMDSGMVVMGPMTAKFEEAFAELCGVKHAIAVSSGTTALHLALLAHNIGPGDEVITTAFSFAATVNAILFVGARPVFADIDEQTFNIKPGEVESLITPRTKAIMPVHLYGHLCDMDELLEISNRYSIPIIEDACQAVSASYKNRRAGSFGTAAFSFYATKNLMCGEGGMITTDDDEIADSCRLLRSHGMRKRYYHEMLGFNYRMTDIEAAIGLTQLNRLPEFNARRSFNAAYLSAKIESVETPRVKEGHVHAWHQYTVRINHGRIRDEAVRQLNDAGIGTGIFYPVPLHQQAYIRKIVGNVTLPTTEKMASEVFSLPVHTQLTKDDLEMIVQEVNRL